jgi:hypothetical protein
MSRISHLLYGISPRLLVGNDSGPVVLAAPVTGWLTRRTSVMKHTNHSTESRRYELVHDEDADFIAYQRKFGDGLWQTVSTWMIPRTDCR